MGRKPQTIIAPVHQGRNSVTLKRVDPETYEGFNHPDDMQTFVVSVGWADTYISPSTRRHYSTYSDRIDEYKRAARNEARYYNDEIVNVIVVSAHSRQDVVKMYDINDTNALCGPNGQNRKKFFKGA